MKMVEVYILHVGRYWPDVICYTTKTNPGDYEVKVMDLEILCLSFWLKMYRYIYPEYVYGFS